MNKFLKVFNKQDKTYQDIANQLGLSKSAIWLIINADRGTRYKIAVEIGKQLGMNTEEIKTAWLELMNDIAKQEINRYETAAEKPKIYPKTKKNRGTIYNSYKESKKPVLKPKNT